jgi:beta-1,4-N-acetylglucosaminyltransferase
MYLVSVRPLLKKGAFRQPFADLLILNGPGTCVILCAVVLLNRVSSRFLSRHARIILIHDLATLIQISLSDYLAHGLCTLSLLPVSSLSHFLESCSIILPIGKIVVLSTAKITYPPSSFVVQWPDLVQPGGREVYRGCLV